MSNKNTTGAPARRAVREYFAQHVHNATADGLLRALEKDHLIITQRPYEKPVRRGNDLGPLIGKSHSAVLAGGAS